MSRKKKKKESDSEKTPIFSMIKKETLHGVIAVLFFAIALFLLLARFSIAGVVGEHLYNLLSLLLGVGYYLLPILFFILSFTFFKSTERSVALPQTIGAVLFVFSGLGIIDSLLINSGGYVGGAISSPLIAFFDIYFTLILLATLLVISLLVMFDAPLKIYSLSNLFSFFTKKTDTQEDGDVSIVLPTETAETEEAEEEPVEEKPEKITNSFSSRKEKPTGDFVIQSNPFHLHAPYTPPPLSILQNDKGKPGVGDIKANANLIKRTLQNFGIKVEMDEISIGPTVTRYALKPAEGVRLSKIEGLHSNLSLALAAHPIRIEAPIPGKSLVGIEIPNTTKTTVGLASLLSTPDFTKSEKALMVALGKSISGQALTANLAKMPHLLIAGATGSGKSVTIHAVITSLLYRNSPEHLKFIMVDPKRVELTLYNKIPHLLTPVITDPKKSILALKWAAKEMDRRYDILQQSSVQNIESYHKNVLEPKLKKYKEKIKDTNPEDVPTEERPELMPYIVIIIDELADLMQAYPRELESAVVRLTQMSRAVGIHLILSTQRPSVNVITGLIKANVPSRIALQVASQIDSRTILDASGAEKLLGAGDMLYQSGEMSKPQRLQSAFITEDEVKKVVRFLADAYAEEIPEEIDFSTGNGAPDSPNAIFSSSLEDEDEDDELYGDARETVIHAGKASTSYLQRKLRVGYARAARLMDMLEENGVIGQQEGSKPRSVLTEQPDQSNNPQE